MSDLFLLKVSRSTEVYTLTIATEQFRAAFKLKRPIPQWLIGLVTFVIAFFRTG